MKKNNRLVFILFNVKKSATSFEKIVEQQNYYVKAFNPIKGQKPIAIVSGCNETLFKPFSKELDFHIISKKNINFFLFILKAYFVTHKYNSKMTKFLFIAGTPLQPLLIVQVLKKVFKDASSHVSIHMDLNSLKNSGFINYFKLRYMVFMTKNVNVVRFVSEQQKFEAQKFLNLSDKKIVICPIPINLHNFKISNKVSKKMTIGFVGRLHVERGISDWLYIIERLPNYIGLVIGEGPLRSKFEKKFQNVLFFGEINHEDISRYFQNFGLFLSTAEHESYGMAIREALLSGVPVLTRKTLGIQEILINFPKIVIPFNNRNNAIKIIKKFPKSLPKSEFKRFRDYFEQKQMDSLAKLGEAWRSV